MKLPKFLLDALGARPDERVVAEYNKLLRLQEITRALNSELDAPRLLRLIMDSVVELTGAERGFLILKKADGDTKVEIARNLDREDLKRAAFKFSRSISERVMASGEAVRTDSATEDDELAASKSIASLKLLSVLCVPLKGSDRSVLGVIYVDNRFKRGSFGDEHLELLGLFASQAAVAIENARLHGELVAAQRELAGLNEKLLEQVDGQQREIEEVRSELAEATRELQTKYDYGGIIGRSAAMQKVFRLLDRVTDKDVPVLIQGESGTGKELVARAVHYNGPRADRRFCSENCAAISEGLLESELFGHVRGAFTGATSSRRGLFEEADGGTMFLDEIGEMSLPMQAKLLRVLQDGEIRPVGGNRTVHVDARILSATNQDLTKLVREGGFREDLYYRLNVVTISLPPLRERRDDVPLLVDHFLERIAEETGQPVKRLHRSVLRYLIEASWPGNVRQLENEIRRLAALSDETIGPDLIEGMGGSEDVDRAREVEGLVGLPLKEVERRLILSTLERVGGNKKEAARVLGISRRSLYDRLARFAESEVEAG
jgi:transcriptional regulator with GAF, ATPase, and Fis domain